LLLLFLSICGDPSEDPAKRRATGVPAPGEREKAYKFKGATKHNWLVTVRHPDAVVRFASVTRTGDRIREVLRLAGKWSYPLRRGRFMLELDWSSIIEVQVYIRLSVGSCID
jgi:hypothetical protein